MRAARHPIAHTLHAALDGLAVPPQASVVLAVSGGADSMALLAAAAGLVGRGRVQPVVMHVDHGLRPESAREGAVVEAACQRAGLHCVRARVNLAGRGGNISARARAARYRVLAACAVEHGAQWVATAHHADDQLETMVMALGRGMGLARLGGMRSARTLATGRAERKGAAPRVTLIRPLLGVDRHTLREACRALDLAWCEDPGNADLDRPRGTVRHRVIPALNTAWPGCSERAARNAVTLQWAAERLDRAARALLRRAGEGEGNFDRSVLRGAPLPVLAAAVRLSIHSAGCGKRTTAPSVASAAVSGAVAWRIAQAIAGPAPRPRRWRLACGVNVRVTARTYCVLASSLG